MLGALCGFRLGDRVIVTARDEFCAFIDGWVGKVSGAEAGCIRIEVPDEGITKVFLVPPDQLRLTV
ncbi:hypothetical protein [Pandoraea sp. 64-18]|uniref:hypothetical protein n=1 Tax=Pandoraea sp. 64-18 TaxID=1895806 RepID=UPI00095B8A2F|nr:hypothetical protein [Pandoraea sp. 64-18]OJY20746.1 MAG: hypothetical protein BGP02_09840 [Pandoraea sp. 64-18]